MGNNKKQAQYYSSLVLIINRHSRPLIKNRARPICLLVLPTIVKLRIWRGQILKSSNRVSNRVQTSLTQNHDQKLRALFLSHHNSSKYQILTQRGAQRQSLVGQRRLLELNLTLKCLATIPKRKKILQVTRLHSCKGVIQKR